MEPKPGMLMDEATATQLRENIAKGVLGAGVFNTDDCRATYEELKGRGVQFLTEPAERPYGIEAVFKDDSGNWFTLTQHSAGESRTFYKARSALFSLVVHSCSILFGGFRSTVWCGTPLP